MQAAFIREIRTVEIGELQRPVPRGDELLIEIEAVGICGSDLHYYLEGAIGAQVVEQGFVPGHEFAGRVLAGSSGDHGIAAGTLVAVDPATPCGTCEWCHRGHVNLCPNVVFKGAPPHQGAMAGVIAVRPEALFPVPDGFDATDAAMLEPLGVAVHAIDLAKPRLLGTCAVIGCGAIGLLALQVARVAGVGTMIGVEPVAERRAAALELGADAAVACMAEPRRRPAAVVSISCSRRRIGRGLPARGRGGTDRRPLRADRHPRRGPLRACRLPGPSQGSVGQVRAAHGPRLSPGHRVVRRGRVNVRRLATHHFPLDRAADAFAMQAAREGGIVKAILHPGG